MNALKVKNFLWKNGLTVSSIAERVAPKYGTASKHSIRVMLTRMFYHDDHNERLAKIVKDEIGLDIPKPRKPQTVIEAVKQAA